MHTRTVEIWVGVFVAAGLAALFMLAMQVSNLSSLSEDEGYLVTARFENINGLKVRAAVNMAGVRIGRVSAIDFDPETFEAVVNIRIDSRYDKIPVDSIAGVYTAGLLGEKYVGVKPGVEYDNLKNGDRLKGGQSAIVLEDLIGQFLFSKAADGGSQ
ncbi:MAG: outer membrane lipid asymmetry maintenance protein MlaD [Thiotrichales bacterium SG8_50]|nr:MAG: outer membrane lipid asymmetry maintenance protein MlaD [Thiotrichales bacterium SG8_50]